MTYPQKGIWYTEKLYPGTSIGNVAGTLKLKGNIDYELLEKAVNMFIEYNDATRLRIIEIDKEPFQYVTQYEYLNLELQDFSSKDKSELFQWEEDQAKIPFSIIDSELIYFSLIKIDENNGGFFARMHHLISDAWTMSLLGSQIVSYYTALKNGNSLPVENNYSYIDYIKSEQEYKKSNRFLKDQEYWNKIIDNLPELTTLKSRSTKALNTSTKRKTFLLPKKFTLKMYEFCKVHKTSVPALFVAGLSMYINRVMQKEDIVIGTAILNRSNYIEKNVIGMFISTIPLRIKFNDNVNFVEFLQEFSKEWMMSLKHQRYPYELIQKAARNKNGFTENIYDILISYQNAKVNIEEQSEDYESRWHYNGHQTESLAIHINDRDEDGILIVNYDFLADLFCAKEIEFIHEHIIRLLWHAIDNPFKLISSLDMISENEKNKILYDFNNKNIDFPSHFTINELFEEQVMRAPDNIAVVTGDNKLTYGQVNKKANQLARKLRNRGVTAEDVVGIMVNRSPDMIIGILGIIKAGGAFLPIDPEYPAERINYFLEDSRARLLLVNKPDIKVRFGGEVICINSEEIGLFSSENLDNIVQPGNLAYVIYTSGSTGQPKGVMITHRSYVNATFAWRKEYCLNTFKIKLLQIASFAFDVFAGDFSRALLNGGTMVICSDSERYNPTKIHTLINKHNISIFESTPALIVPLMKYIYDNGLDVGSLRLLIIGSDICKIEDFNFLLQKFGSSIRIINSYGVTEATIDSSYYEEPLYKTNKKGITPIGKPMPNMKFLILNKNLQLQPIGIYGDLYISGLGVARGYINKPDLTAERFLKNPFDENELMYYTGDLARWTSQGNAEFLGRIDDQVKIRGYRIETEEISRVILDFEAVDDAVVVAKTFDDGKKYLCAYYKSNNNIRVSDLKNYLRIRLPDYMIPTYYIRLMEFPLTSSGKINKHNLPAPNTSIKTNYKAPRNNLDSILTNVYKEVLNVAKVGINDDFFEMGGDSLTIIKVQIKLFSHDIEIATQDIYDYPTIRLLSNKISSDRLYMANY